MQNLPDIAAILGLDDIKPESEYMWIDANGGIVHTPYASHDDMLEESDLTPKQAFDAGWVKVSSCMLDQQISITFNAYALRPMAISVLKSVISAKVLSRYALHIQGAVTATLHLISVDQCMEQIERFGRIQHAGGPGRFAPDDGEIILSIMARISGLTKDQVVRHAKVRMSPQGIPASDMVASMTSLGWKLEGMFEMPWMGSPGMTVDQAARWFEINAPYATAICMVKIDGKPHPLLFIDGEFNDADAHLGSRISGVFVCTPEEITKKTEKKLVTVYDESGEAIVAPKAAVAEVFENILESIFDAS